jgi:hypothetical protein
MVMAATIASGSSSSSDCGELDAIDLVDDRTMPKAPALTTATACSSADTGAGATIASGSQPCSGTSAALTPRPAISSRKMILS